MSKLSKSTEILHSGRVIRDFGMEPEALPCFLTTAFNMHGLENVQNTYATKGWTYMRMRNPNRTSLAEMMTNLECGEESLICTSGMAAISSTFLALLGPGDHVLCNSRVYGEVLPVMSEIMSKHGVEVTYVDFVDTENIRRAIRENTKMVYSEVFVNPTLALVDLKTVAEIAHEHNALFMVDNTFTTPIAIRPLEWGADIVINSLTKFLNGHSDATGGSITSTKEICNRINPISVLLGSPCDPFSCWLIYRGISTAHLRVPKQMRNAELLANALREQKIVSRVDHPSVPDYPQKKLAESMFQNGYCAMLSFELPEDDMEKINQFMLALKLVPYAPTLGGLRTTISHPVTTSHSNVPDDIRRKMGITPGLIRVSVGLEDMDDIINDFVQAMKVFD